MNRTTAKRLGWMMLGLAICLAVSSCRTCQKPQHIANDRASIEKAVLQKMQRVVIPEFSFRPPDTIIDALDFFNQANRDFDKPGIPLEECGVSFILKLSPSPRAVKPTEGDDPFAGGAASSLDAPVIPAMTARHINLYDALKLVCEVTGMKFEIRGGLIMITPLDDSDGELLSRVYHLQQSSFADKFNSSENTPDEATQNKADMDWKLYFEGLGVTWPTGSSITFQETPSMRFQVTNTRENLERIGQLLKDSGNIPQMIDIDLQVVAFRPEDIEKLQLAGGVSTEFLMALRKAGKAKFVASAQTSIRSGQEAVMKAVQEIIYPTEVSAGIGQSEDGNSASEAGYVEQCNFEMRQVGVILQVIPEISPNRTWIELMLNPECVTLTRWENFPVTMAWRRTHKTVPFRQPVFAVTSFQTQITVEDGETVLLGSGGSSNGGWIDYGFLTVRLVPVQKSLRKP